MRRNLVVDGLVLAGVAVCVAYLLAPRLPAVLLLLGILWFFRSEDARIGRPTGVHAVVPAHPFAGEGDQLDGPGGPRLRLFLFVAGLAMLALAAAAVETAAAQALSMGFLAATWLAMGPVGCAWLAPRLGRARVPWMVVGMLAAPVAWIALCLAGPRVTESHIQRALRARDTRFAPR